MDKFWTKLATFSERVNRSMWSWNPSNLETLTVQALFNLVIVWLMWDYSIFKIIGVGYFILAVPINLFFLLKDNKDG